MNRLSTLVRADGPATLRAMAIVALTVGIGVWGALLLAPAPSGLPPTLELSTPSGRDTSAVARWFGGGALRVRVTVEGLISSDGGRGAALLTVNGGAAQAFRPGQTLAPGVTLAGVTANAVSIDQDGVIEQVAVPVNPATVVQGFIPVTGSAAARR